MFCISLLANLQTYLGEEMYNSYLVSLSYEDEDEDEGGDGDDEEGDDDEGEEGDEGDEGNDGEEIIDTGMVDHDEKNYMEVNLIDDLGSEVLLDTDDHE